MYAGTCLFMGIRNGVLTEFNGVVMGKGNRQTGTTQGAVQF
jgi:hypothetical protein